LSEKIAVEIPQGHCLTGNAVLNLNWRINRKEKGLLKFLRALPVEKRGYWTSKRLCHSCKMAFWI